MPQREIINCEGESFNDSFDVECGLTINKGVPNPTIPTLLPSGKQKARGFLAFLHWVDLKDIKRTFQGPQHRYTGGEGRTSRRTEEERTKA